MTAEAPAPLQGRTPAGQEDDWNAAAAAVLRKAGRLAPHAPADEAWSRLSRRTLEGLTVPPLGTPGRAAAVPEPGQPGRPPYTRGSAVGRPVWDIRAAVCVADPAAAAATTLSELTGGASSVWLTLTAGAAGLPEVLHEVRLDLAPVGLTSTGAVSDLESARALAALLGSVPDRHPGHQLGGDPIGRQLRDGSPADLRAAAEFAEIARTLGIRALVVDGTAAHERGAGDAAELGWSLAVAVAYLRALETAGIGLADALPLLEFRYAVTDEQFPSIAKLRAARRLWDRVAELSGAGADRPGQLQHAVTSRPMLTRYDSYTNLLRTTVAAFAAGVGGADAITVLPFDVALGEPDALGRRMARNIAHLLTEESHVAVTADPAGGAHAVELLTDELAEAAWAEFGRIEEAGGALAALADGSVTERWQATADLRARLVATRRQPITGVSEFPNATEQLPVRRPSSLPRVAGWAAPFESLRDNPCAAPLFLATLGPVSAHTARATFAGNLFAAGGIDARPAGATATAQEVVAAYRAADTPAVVCLAGADSDYLSFGPELVPALRRAGASRILLAGKADDCLAGLLDDHIAAGQDALAFLHRTRDALTGKES